MSGTQPWWISDRMMYAFGVAAMSTTDAMRRLNDAMPLGDQHPETG